MITHIQFPESPLTRENYYDFKEYEGQKVMHSSALRHIYPGEGGSLKRLELYFEGKLGKQEKPYQNLGQIFHKYMENRNVFEIEPAVLPEPAIAEVVKMLNQTVVIPTKNLNDISDSIIGEICIDLQYQNNWKPGTRIDKIREKGSVYFNFLREATGKHMLTQAQSIALEGIKTSTENSPFAEKLFDKRALHEVPVLWKNEHGIWCKALIDWLLIDDYVAEFIDYKSTSKPVGSFLGTIIAGFDPQTGKPQHEWVPGSLFNYRYYRQTEFYDEAVGALLNQLKLARQIKRNIYAVESVQPYENLMIEGNYDLAYLGRTEIEQCMIPVRGQIASKKKY